jgi:sialic acid synthase SpsE
MPTPADALRIGPFDTFERVLVVAEAGNNHEGDADRARALVRAAAGCEAHAIKFQTFRAAAFGRPSDRERYAQLSRFELSPATFAELAALARSEGLLFISTPLDMESVGVLEPLVDAFKVASGDNNFYPLIDRIARTGKPVLVSTGLSDLQQVRATVERLRSAWRRLGDNPGLGLMHCVSSYPAPPDEVNLAAIGVLERETGLTVGYSDHTLGIDACVAAVAAGARVVEKHFTLDRQTSTFRDHAMSADPAEMTQLVREVARMSTLVGRPEKVVRASERAGVVQYRRSIVAAADLPEGHQLCETDLTWLRPGGGLAPGEESRLIGRVLARRVARGDQILASDVR